MAVFRFSLLALSLLGSLLAPSAAAAPLETLDKRTVTLDGAAARLGGGSYPRATRLQDGSMLACWAAPSNGNSVLTTTKSTNNGRSWTTIGSIATAPSATRDLDNCFVHQLPNGRVLAAYRNHDRQSASGPYTFYRITVSYSDDNGVTWHYLDEAATSATPKLGIWEPFMLDALDGSLMLFFSRETNTDGSDQDSILIRSTNGGLNWSAEQTITGADRTNRDGMLGVVRTGGSNLLAVFESLSPDTGINSVTSTDDGKTWGNRRVVYRNTASGVHHGAPQVALVGNKLVTSFQVNEDDQSRVDVKVVTSTNGGASWAEKTTVLTNTEWAGELTVDSGHVLVLATQAGVSVAQTLDIA